MREGCEFMAITTLTNTAIVEKKIGTTSYQVPSTPVNFQAGDELGIVITKTIDRPGEMYYQGETIVFTITLTRAAGVTSTINQITLTDEVPAIVKYTKDNIKQTVGAAGNISVSGQTLKITELTLNNGNPTITFVITGKIDIAH